MKPLKAFHDLSWYSFSSTTFFILLLTLLLADCGGGENNGTEKTCSPPPHFNSSPPTQATAQQNYAYMIDAEHECNWLNIPLICGDVRAITLPPGARFGSGGYDYLSWTPSVSQANSNVKFSVATVPDDCGNSATQSWTVHVFPDTSAPTISNIYPANGVGWVPPNSTISASFSEPVDPQSLTTASFIVSSPSGPIPGDVKTNGSNVTFTPSINLPEQTTFTVTITKAVDDLSGNALASDYTWIFSTGVAPDITPPNVSITSPTDNATGVAVYTPITATFSEIMDPTTVTNDTFTLNNGVTGTVYLAGNTANFTPSSNLAYTTTYTATITSGVHDAAGNAMAIPYTWTFTTDGVHWNKQISGTTVGLHGVTWSGTKFVAVGDPYCLGTCSNSAILTSPDGIIWSQQNSGTTNSLFSIAWSGTQFVVVGINGTILSSPDGIVWSQQNSGTTNSLFSIAWSGTQFVVVGINGMILTSPDGVIWSTQTSGTTALLRGISWSGTRFVAVGGDINGRGTILTSPDSVTWTTQTPPGTPYILDAVVWSGTEFVAVGVSGTIITSFDGITWAGHPSGTTALLAGISCSGTQFAAIGSTRGADGGTILTSPDGVIWAVQMSDTGAGLEGVSSSGTRFVTVGAFGTILTAP
jgi:hypothetical protein